MNFGLPIWLEVFRFVVSILLDPRFCAEKRFHYLARDAVRKPNGGGTHDCWRSNIGHPSMYLSKWLFCNIPLLSPNNIKQSGQIFLTFMEEMSHEGGYFHNLDIIWYHRWTSISSLWKSYMMFYILYVLFSLLLHATKKVHKMDTTCPAFWSSFQVSTLLVPKHGQEVVQALPLCYLDVWVFWPNGWVMLTTWPGCASARLCDGRRAAAASATGMTCCDSNCRCNMFKYAQIYVKYLGWTCHSWVQTCYGICYGQFSHITYF